MDDNLQKLHPPIDNRIVQHLLAVIPEGWWSIVLDVTRDAEAAEESELSLSISSDEGYRDIVMPPSEMYETVIQHADLFASHGQPWSTLRYRVFFDEAIDNWRFTIEYDYA